MDNMDGITRAYHKMLAHQYDMMMMYFNASDAYKYSFGEREKKFIEFRKTCNIPITSFDEKVAFMIQFNEVLEKSQKKEKSIELAKRRYDSKSSLWKFLHKKLNPETIDFQNMSTSEIDNLYVEEKDSKKM